MGKVSRETGADGSFTAFEYNRLGLVEKITDGEGVQW
ncbi:MAG: RHS repeat protein, partial [Treponema sp.]|nr:RHS repeat protein [Treponema sp.]